MSSDHTDPRIDAALAGEATPEQRAALAADAALAAELTALEQTAARVGQAMTELRRAVEDPGLLCFTGARAGVQGDAHAGSQGAHAGSDPAELAVAERAATDALGQLAAVCPSPAAFADTIHVDIAGARALDQLAAATDATRAAFADTFATRVAAEDASRQLADAAPSPADFACTFATGETTADASRQLADAAPSPADFADTFATGEAASGALSELADAAPAPAPFAETFATGETAADAARELADAAPDSGEFAAAAQDQVLTTDAMAELAAAAPDADSFVELAAIAARVTAAMQELRDQLPPAAAFSEDFSSRVEPRDAIPLTPAQSRPRRAAPPDARIEAAMAGELSSGKLKKLRANPALAEELAELEALAELVERSMGELAEAAPSSRKAAGGWAATARYANGGAIGTPRNRVSSRRRPAPISRRSGLAAAMLMGVALLGALGFAVIPRAVEHTRHKTALAQLNTLQLALVEYKHDYDAYPPTGDDSLVRYLDGDPSNGGPDKEYFRFRVLSKVTLDLRYLDPWGRPYRYMTGEGTHNEASFDLWSLGPPDRRVETVLGNWIDGLMQPPPE